jgi:hypothetical protein
MKAADLKAGELYAVRHSDEPHLLLSDKVHSNWYTRHGYVMLRGPADVLRLVDLAVCLAHLEEYGLHPQCIPPGCHITMAISLPSILGPFGEVMAVRDAKEAEKLARYKQLLDRYNAAVDVINLLLGAQYLIPHGREHSYGDPPATITLTLEQVICISALRDDETREVRWLLAAADRMRDDWAEGSDVRVKELWRGVHAATEVVHERFHDRIADLDHRAAQLPDFGLVAKP